jgi:hypothetical protein
VQRFIGVNKRYAFLNHDAGLLAVLLIPALRNLIESIGGEQIPQRIGLCFCRTMKFRVFGGPPLRAFADLRDIPLFLSPIYAVLWLTLSPKSCVFWAWNRIT